MDRHHSANGKIHLLWHVFIVMALSNISVSVEHMRSLEIDEFQNSVFLAASLVAYYFALFLLPAARSAYGAAPLHLSYLL